jgi:uncharacterized membrane protein YkoI
MRSLARGLAVLVAVALLVPAAPAGDEEEIPLSKVPKKVLDAVKAKYPGADLRSATRGTEDKEVYYSIVLKHKDEEYEVTLTPEGEITEVAKDIPVKDLPRAVAEALAKKYPGATIEEASEGREPGANGKVTYYVELTTAAKKRLEVTLDPRGKVEKEKEIKKR